MSKKLWMIISVCLVLLCGTTSLQAASDFKATVSGLASSQCPNGEFKMYSFSFGANNPVTIGRQGLSSGKAQVSELNLQKSFDACSAGLFQATAVGLPVGNLSLTQTDTDETGKTRITLMIDLTTVFVSSYQISGASGGGASSESVSFSFAKIMITDPISGAKTCWDVTLNSKCQ